MLISDRSPEDVIREWNNWSDGPKLPADPNIPVSADGKYQIYPLQVRQQDGSQKIMYAVPVDGLNGYGDSLHETIADAVKEADLIRKQQREREENRAQEERKRLQRLEEKRKREDMHGFTDGLIPLRKGQVIQHMQKMYTFSAFPRKVMSLRDFIHQVYALGCPDMKIFEDKFDTNGRPRPVVRRTYFVNHEEVGKIAYDYLQYLIKNNIELGEVLG